MRTDPERGAAPAARAPPGRARSAATTTSSPPSPAGPACRSCGLIRQPTLVMGGDDDPIIPVVNARMLARLIPPRAAAHLPRRAPRHPHRGRRAGPRHRAVPRLSRPHRTRRHRMSDLETSASTTPRSPTSSASSCCSTTQDRELLSSVRAFMTREVEPVINDYWTRAEFPHDLSRASRARHRRPAVRRPGLSRPRRPARRDDRDGAGPGRPVDRHLHGRARRPGDGLDRPVRLRRAARALAAGDGADGADRRLRADRARRRLRRSPPGWPPPPGATATSGCSTARRSGSATRPSPTSS